MADNFSQVSPGRMRAELFQTAHAEADGASLSQWITATHGAIVPGETVFEDEATAILVADAIVDMASNLRYRVTVETEGLLIKRGATELRMARVGSTITIT
jgi:putative hemolysin